MVEPGAKKELTCLAECSCMLATKRGVTELSLEYHTLTQVMQDTVTDRNVRYMWILGVTK